MGIKTLLIGRDGAENRTSDYAVFVYKGNDNEDEFQGDIFDALADLTGALAGILSSDDPDEILGQFNWLTGEFGDFMEFCEDHGLPEPDADAAIGCWHLQCLPQGSMACLSGYREYLYNPDRRDTVKFREDQKKYDVYKVLGGVETLHLA